MILDTCFIFIFLFFTKIKVPHKNTGINPAPADLSKIPAQVHILAMKRFRLNRRRSESLARVKKYITATVNAINKGSLSMRWVFHSNGREIETSIPVNKAIPLLLYIFFINRNVKIEVTAWLITLSICAAKKLCGVIPPNNARSIGKRGGSKTNGIVPLINT